MLKPKKIKLLLLTIFLSSCQSVKPIVLNNCSRQILFKTEGAKRYVIEDESFCACRNYKFSKEYIGPTGGEVEHDIDSEACKQLVGYPLDDYGKLIKWLRNSQAKINGFLKK